MMGHGWTRIHTDKIKALVIRVNPCPSVANLFFAKLGSD
jgi:hypothetical protein